MEEEVPAGPVPKQALIILTSTIEYPDGSPTGFWLGEAVVLIAVAWFTHFQHVQLIRTSEKRLGDSSTARAAPAISSRSARTSARTSAPATRDGWYMLEEGAPRRDRTVVAEYVRLQRERRKEWTRMV